MSISKILSVSEQVKDNRTTSQVMLKVMEEVGELSTEITIANGNSYKEASVDGVIGEAVDSIITLLDVIKIHNPEITEDEISEIMHRKSDKWVAKSKEIADKQKAP